MWTGRDSPPWSTWAERYRKGKHGEGRGKLVCLRSVARTIHLSCVCIVSLGMLSPVNPDPCFHPEFLFDIQTSTQSFANLLDPHRLSFFPGKTREKKKHSFIFRP